MSASSRKRRKAASPAANNSAPEPRPASALRTWFPFLLAALVAVLYWPALSGPFVYDDYDLMEGFSAVRVGTFSALIASGRPLLMATFVLSHRLVGGFDPWSFHLANVALHALNGLLLWRLCLALFVPGRFDSRTERFRSLFIYGLPLLFLVAPMQTESVAYISSRSELLSTAFYLAGLWAFVVWRDRSAWAAAALTALCFAAAALSKQDKLTLPFAILLLDYLLLSRGNLRELRKSLPTYGLFGLGIIAGFFLVVRPFLFAVSAGFSLDWQPYLFTQFRMIFRYLGQLLIPVGLNIDPQIVVSQSVTEHFSWLALLALIALVAVAVRFHRQAPTPVFGLLFFLLAIAPSTSFYPLLDFAADRRVYLPSIGFFLALLWLLTRLFEPSSKTPAAVLAAVCLAYSAATFQRAQVWSSELLLWQDAARKSPAKARPLTWLGRIYFNGGRLPDALRYWQRAEQFVEQNSLEQAYLLNNLGLAAARAKNYDQAIRYYKKALAIREAEPNFWAQLAVAQMRAGLESEGWESFEQGIRYKNRLGPEYFQLRAQERYRTGAYAEAVSDYETALAYRPDNQEVRKNFDIARRAAARQR